uniref:FTS and Hook-interacting protein-like n=1 Tax=Petromyzon marinus TaxID=7757 RepID=A0AAJ7UAQ0_PETMA|nr:FTS and Hook-interacting protein-like [Petromyzon marinus]XP_032832978.1 FTS and Hook-interacting protein-like [Petromyzon marinus]XP_032832979.1 FTS and Hook-interacting protein-like [Petromyzon marinus]XP_032832980.1 FTS and Hook-interacting protein-like [Petromyzon marinus]
MSWLSRFNARGGPGGRKAEREVAAGATGVAAGAPAAGPVAAAVAAAQPEPPSSPGADPETCLMVYRNHWMQVLKVIERNAGGGRDGVASSTAPADEKNLVRNNVDQMLYLLAEELPPRTGGMGPILEFTVSDEVLGRVVSWGLRMRTAHGGVRGQDAVDEEDEEVRAEQLKMYEVLVSQSHQPLLHHKPILHPLLGLMAACANSRSPKVETNLVLLLSQLCSVLVKDPATLELVFNDRPSPLAPSGGAGAAGFAPRNDALVFALLVGYVHREGSLGQQARDALLLIMSLTAENRSLGEYIADRSDFCPVLATGLSGLYSSLPRKIEVNSDEWHSLRREDWLGVPALVRFMNSLEFCNAVVQVAHEVVRNQLIKYIYHGFLIPVMGPALDKTLVEEQIASTAYLDLFLRMVTEPSLLRTFLHFVLLHSEDDKRVLDMLVARISSSSRLCMVSLALFRTLLSLNCEDVMLQLVLRFLIPCNHVMLSQRRAVKEVDLYGRTADRLLSLSPECCRLEQLLLAEREDEHVLWSKGLVCGVSEGQPSASPTPKPTTPARMGFFSRQKTEIFERQQRSPAVHEQPARPQSPASTALASPPQQQQQQQQPPLRPGGGNFDERTEAEPGYLQYLRDARRGVRRCALACRAWSAPYDGETPAPGSVVIAPSEALASLPLDAEHFALERKLEPPAESPEWDIRLDQYRIAVFPHSKKRSVQRRRRQGAQNDAAVPCPPKPAGDQNGLAPTSAILEGDSRSEAPSGLNGADSARSGEGGVVQAPEASDDDPMAKKQRREKRRESHDDDDGEVGGASVANGSAAPIEPVIAPPRGQPRPSAESAAWEETESDAPASAPAGSCGRYEGAAGMTVGDAPAEASSALDESVDSLIQTFLEGSSDDASGLVADLHKQSLVAVAAGVTDAEESSGDAVIGGDETAAAIAPDCVAADFSALSEQVEPRGMETPTQAQAHVVTLPALLAQHPSQAIGTPFTGPFVGALFAKLENMMQNSLYVNLLLTGVVTQLACYPQPLVRSFLLNTNMVFQPSVKSLVQVLGTVKNRIEAFAAGYDDFPPMVVRAWQYLITRGQSGAVDSPLFVPALSRAEQLGEAAAAAVSATACRAGRRWLGGAILILLYVCRAS